MGVIVALGAGVCVGNGLGVFVLAAAVGVASSTCAGIVSVIACGPQAARMNIKRMDKTVKRLMWTHLRIQPGQQAGPRLSRGVTAPEARSAIQILIVSSMLTTENARKCPSADQTGDSTKVSSK